MAKKLGNDKQLWIQSATLSTYNALGGQGGLKYSRKAGTIDTSDKNTAPYGTAAPGNFDLGISQSGVVDLPDANGLERANTLFKSRTAEKFQIRKAPFSATDIVFEGLMYITGLDIDEPKDGATGYELTLVPAAAPITDTLG